MLKLIDITKNYKVGEETIEALKGLNIEFRKNEFVSILGPSGCGKTTLLNLVGGLDQYTSGDLIIEGKSTKLFKDKDWDAYRNKKVGFVFQNYYLIPHQNVSKNVEMALTLSGKGTKERKEQAKSALDSVGLGDQLNKKPNQLSGGQMQRVSIARALVNNPDIILADEPTGALDSNTSVQIMEILAEIAKEKLVIMVTHNSELAKQYSTRIISLLDGEKVGDTNPYESVPEAEAIITEPKADESIPEAKPKEAEGVISKTQKFWRNLGKKKRIKKDKTSMAFSTAIKLSLSNLLTKKVRTSITAIAGSIGIIGVGLVLAISNGFSAYIDQMERNTLGGFPIMVTEMTYDQAAISKMTSFVKTTTSSELEAYPKDGKVTTKEATMGMGNSIEDMMASLKKMVVTNQLTEEYFDYLGGLNPKLGSVHYIYNLEMNILSHNIDNLGKDKYNVVSRGSIGWQQLLGTKDFVLGQYDVIAGKYPENAFETVIFVDKYNRIEASVLQALGIDVEDRIKNKEAITLEELMVSDVFKYAENNAYYVRNSYGVYGRKSSIKGIYEDPACHPIQIVGIMRAKPGVDFEMLSTGIAYTKELVDFAFQKGAVSNVVLEQKLLLSEAKAAYQRQKELDKQNGVVSSKDMELINVLSGSKFSASAEEMLMQTILGIEAPKAESLCLKVLQRLGGDKTPTSAYIFPADFDSKDEIKTYLNGYNKTKAKNERVTYTDMAETATGVANEIINIITIVLSCFAGISLVVSSVMIGIITYVSVVERTQEIGILRSIGARKFDIFSVFNAETTIIGFVSGVIGIVVTYLLSIPINLIIKHYAGLTANIAALIPYNAVILVAISVALTFIAGLIPAYVAAKKNPVLALRSD